ncbi:uncharacterized protein LOC116573249 isoform X2 [Mustela erminea]|uniref:uncharacterized protein LOC116573249 isoform X2 n=1 Tax=Mustela erminea TaxID=36723 RepID=UPI00138721F6|nr:uncharacterized protein LOC116573249 isoform X2 [Mustela erminea]
MGSAVPEHRWPHPGPSSPRKQGALRKVVGPHAALEQHLLPPARRDNLVTPGTAPSRRKVLSQLGAIGPGRAPPWVGCTETREGHSVCRQLSRSEGKPASQVSLTEDEDTQCLATSEKHHARKQGKYASQHAEPSVQTDRAPARMSEYKVRDRDRDKVRCLGENL